MKSCKDCLFGWVMLQDLEVFGEEFGDIGRECLLDGGEVGDGDCCEWWVAEGVGLIGGYRELVERGHPVAERLFGGLLSCGDEGEGSSS